MKKLLFLIIIFFIPMSSFAKEITFYSDREIPNLKNCDIEILDNYQFYKEKVEYLNRKENINFKSEKFPYRSLNYTLGKEFISNKIIDNNEFILNKEINYTLYQEQEKIKYIYLSNFNSKYPAYIKELYINKNKNERIEYKILKNEELDIILKNGNIYDKYLLNEIIIIELKEEQYLNNLIVSVYYEGRYKDNLSYEISMNNDLSNNEDHIKKKLSIPLSSTEFVNVDISELGFTTKYNNNILKKEGVINNIPFAKIIGYEKEYYYQEKLYDYYQIKKDYQTAIISGESYIKELNGKIYIYKCQNNNNEFFVKNIYYSNLPDNIKYQDKIIYKDHLIYQESENNKESTKNNNYFIKYCLYLGLCYLIYRKR